MIGAERQYCRADQWHAAGYTGKGIKVMVYEVANPTMINYPDYCGKVKDPMGICFGDIPGTHMQDVVDTLLYYAPDVEVYLWRDNLPAAVQFCIDNDIDLFNYSASGSYNTTEFNALEATAIANGTFFVCAAGNDGVEGLTGMAQKDTWLSVGALRMDSAGNIGRTSYSSYDGWGDSLDVMSFGDLIFPDTHDGGTMGVTGTSFASPSIVGMLACFKQRFLQANNRKPIFDEVFDFIVDNSVDIEIEGYDQKTGNGVFRMPVLPILEPLVLKMTIGSTQANVNGEPTTLLAPPLLAPSQLPPGRTYLPVRDIANLIGGTITMNGNEITITIKPPQ
jgi:hypothetical protein